MLRPQAGNGDSDLNRQAKRESAPAEGRIAYQHLYDRRWRKARLAHLAKHPLCAMCKSAGRIEAATIVDHIEPHRGSERLFWARSNWQSLCKPCHDGDKQRLERIERNAVKHDDEGYREGW